MNDSISEFSAWWMDDRQAELRKSCAEGWAYEVWKASRAALQIELPDYADTGIDSGGWPLDSGSHRINKVIGQRRDAIRAAGVKTK